MIGKKPTRKIFRLYFTFTTVGRSIMTKLITEDRFQLFEKNIPRIQAIGLFQSDITTYTNAFNCVINFLFSKRSILWGWVTIFSVLSAMFSCPLLRNSTAYFINFFFNMFTLRDNFTWLLYVSNFYIQCKLPYVHFPLPSPSPIIGFLASSHRFFLRDYHDEQKAKSAFVVCARVQRARGARLHKNINTAALVS